MMMWLMSDRAIPRSLRTMQGFGVHTFRLVTAEGRSTFVKFHWKPLAGVHSVLWEEAQAISGLDPDFHRRDLWNAIENGQFPEWELGVQLISEQDQDRFDFDLLDPTKLVPEELVPVTPIGKMKLNRNPDNFFAETEQVAFHVAQPGARDRRHGRLPAPGAAVLLPRHPADPARRAELPADPGELSAGGGLEPPARRHAPDGRRPLARRLREEHRRRRQPAVSPEGYRSFPEQVEGPKLRKRPESFADHYTQAAMFWRSMADWEKDHIASAFAFELGMVAERDIRASVLDHLGRIDTDLARRVGTSWAFPPRTHGASPDPVPSPALEHREPRRPATVAGRMVAVLAADGFELPAGAPGGHGAGRPGRDLPHRRPARRPDHRRRRRPGRPSTAPWPPRPPRCTTRP